MDDKLLPCPFCGSDKQAFGNVRDGGRLWCRGCGCEFVRYNGPYDLKQRLVDAWNTRTKETRHE